MTTTKAPITICGAGSWGLALANLLSQVACVSIWGRNKTHIDNLRATHRAPNYLPASLTLNEGISFSDDLIESITQNACVWLKPIIIAAPINALRSILINIRDYLEKMLAANVRLSNAAPITINILTACKGFEAITGLLPTQIIEEVFSSVNPAIASLFKLQSGALVGPSFAHEIALGKPALMIVASANNDFIATWAQLFNQINTMRIYGNNDVLGAEIGAGAKNIFAIAAGIADGLELGLNARSALITRALAELTRFVVARGGNKETVYGLSGVGDLILTCTGRLSRNYQAGLLVAKGNKKSAILQTIGHVTEGIASSKEVYHLSNQQNIYMPITAAIYNILYNDQPVKEAIEGLLTGPWGYEI